MRADDVLFAVVACAMVSFDFEVDGMHLNVYYSTIETIETIEQDIMGWKICLCYSVSPNRSLHSLQLKQGITRWKHCLSLSHSTLIRYART